MFSNEREEMRQVYFKAWDKYLQQIPLEPLETQLVEIILLHPEYHPVLAQAEDYQHADFEQGNPFLHLGLHMALREQVNTNRPLGIQQVYQALCIKLGDKHNAEHQMIDVLADVLWQAQQSGKMPDEESYLVKLKQLG